MAMTALLRAWAGEKASEGERARNEGNNDVTSLFTPLWLNQLGQCQRTAATQPAQPTLVGHDACGEGPVQAVLRANFAPP